MLSETLFHSAYSYGSLGSGRSAGRSSRSNSSRRLASYVRIHRLLRSTEQLGDAGVSSAGRRSLVAMPREDPPLRHLHGDFDLGLVRVSSGAPAEWSSRSGAPLVERLLHAWVVLARDRHADFNWSGTTAPGTPPKNATARELLAIQCGSCCVYVASANV